MSRAANASATCVLLPGMLCTSALWRAPAAALRTRAPVVDVPLTAATINGMVDEVVAVPAERLVLIGHSLGGIVAMAAARRHPARVAALALLSTNARPPRPDQRRAWTVLARRTRAGEFDAITAQTLLPTLLHPDRLADRELVDIVVAMAEATGPEVFLRQLTAQQSRVDERPALRQVRCPTLVIAARQDALCPLATHHEIAALVPGAQLAVVEHSGHLSPLEQPDILTRHVLRWVDSLDLAERTAHEPRAQVSRSG